MTMKFRSVLVVRWLAAWARDSVGPAALILMLLALFGASPGYTKDWDMAASQSGYRYWESASVWLGYAVPQASPGHRQRSAQNTAAGGPKPQSITIEFHEAASQLAVGEPFFERPVGACTAGLISLLISCWSLEGLKWASG